MNDRAQARHLSELASDTLRADPETRERRAQVDQISAAIEAALIRARLDAANQVRRV